MDPKLFMYAMLVGIGLFVYIKKRRWVFIYWLSAQAFVLPVILNIVPPNNSVGRGFTSLYFGYITPLCYMLAIIWIIESVKNISSLAKEIYYPVGLLLLFLLVQNIMVQFSYGPLFENALDVIFLVLPTIILCKSHMLRPSKKQLLYFCVIFVFVQVVFCILGIKIYSYYYDWGSWQGDFICGSFYRYNHMTNYLTSMFLFLCIAYFQDKKISTKIFVPTALIMGILVFMSGARMSVILFVFTFISFVLCYQSKNFVKIGLFALVLFQGWLFLSKNYNVDLSDADHSTGIERNVAGIMNIIESKSNDDNTLSLSDFLLLTKFNNPIMGNGYAYRMTKEYELNDTIIESTFKTDARLAFMLVEYGILGCILFAFLFYCIIKVNYLQSSNINKKVWYIVIAYYILFTFTETGMFDVMQLSFLSIFSFAKDENYEYKN